jgi:hypothetical protein
MSSKPITFLTGEEWAARVRAASLMAADLISALTDSCGGPGQAALTAMLVARALCDATGIPPFSWYCARVAELAAPMVPPAPAPGGGDRN